MRFTVSQESHRHLPPACPRGSRPVQGPTAWSSAWRCDWHGEVHPLLPAFNSSREGLDGLLRIAGVPVWLPWPLPAGWLVAGFAGAGDERTGARACAVAVCGPNPLMGGPADMLVVAEEPGVGLGAALAGLDSVDPGADFACAPSVATVSFGNHELPLWQGETPDRAAAASLRPEPSELRDLRDPGQDMDLPFGAASPHLPAR